MKMMRIRGVWTVNAAAFLVGAGHVQLVHPHPAVRRDAEVRGLRLRRRASPARGCSCCPRRSAMLFVSPLAGRMTNRFGARLPLVARIAGDGPGVRLPRRRARRPWEFYVGAAAARHRHRPRLRVAGEPHRRGRAPRPDGRGDRHEHGDADVGGSVGGTIDAQRHRRHRRRRGAADRVRLHGGVRPGRQARACSPRSRASPSRARCSRRRRSRPARASGPRCGSTSTSAR